MVSVSMRSTVPRASVFAITDLVGAAPSASPIFVRSGFVTNWLPPIASGYSDVPSICP